jgi:hypothetical protein
VREAQPRQVVDGRLQQVAVPGARQLDAPVQLAAVELVQERGRAARQRQHGQVR